VENLELTRWNLVWLVAGGAITVLLLLLLASFLSRARVFCQYLRHMTGIELQPGTVRGLYQRQGRGGVRDHLISLLIQEDLSDPDRIVTPDSEPDTSMFDVPS
jgi:hypothetical protein